MTGAIAIIEEVLGHGIVDSDDRKVEHIIRSHGTQTNHTGCRFFRAADNILEKFAAVLMNRRNEIRTIVHGHLRFVIQRRADVLVISHIIFAFDGKGGDFVHIDQCRSNIILSG